MARALATASPPAMADRGILRNAEVFGRYEDVADVAAWRELADARGGARAHLVEPVFAVDDPGALAAESPERVRQDGAKGVIVDPHELVRGARRVGDGSEHIEDSARPELASCLPRVLQRRVVGLREQEHDPAFAQQLALPGGGDVDRDSERFEDVRAAAPARSGSVPVFGHGQAASGHDDGGRRGEVERCASRRLPSRRCRRRAAARARRRSSRRASPRRLRRSPRRVSPVMRSATANAPIWTGVHAPARMASNAERASSALSGSRASSRPSVVPKSALMCRLSS